MSISWILDDGAMSLLNFFQAGPSAALRKCSSSDPSGQQLLGATGSAMISESMVTVICALVHTGSCIVHDPVLMVQMPLSGVGKSYPCSLCVDSSQGKLLLLLRLKESSGINWPCPGWLISVGMLPHWGLSVGPDHKQVGYLPVVVATPPLVSGSL